MNKFLIISLAALVAGCSVVSTDPGEEKVLNAKPWIFGPGGSIVNLK